MIIASFDPGKHSSWAKLNTKKPDMIGVGDVNLVGVGRLMRPCAVHIAEIVKDADLVLIEEVGPRPKEGVASVFTFGMSFGAILSAVQSAHKPLRTVTPAQWSAILRLKAKASTDDKKAAALAYAKELWPCALEEFRIKAHHNRADAALMIKWFLEKGPGRDVE